MLGWTTYQKEILIMLENFVLILYTYKYELRQNAAGYPDQAYCRVGKKFK